MLGSDQMNNFDFDIQQQQKHYKEMEDNANLLFECLGGIKDHASLFKLLLSGAKLINSHNQLLSLEKGRLTISVGGYIDSDVKRIDVSKWRIPDEKDLIAIETANALKKLTLREITLVRECSMPFHIVEKRKK